MMGMRRTSFIRYGRSLAFWLFAALCYLCGLLAYAKIQNVQAVSVFLSSSYPDLKRVGEILESLEEEQEQACFYWDGGLIYVQEEEYGRKARVLLAGLLGDASLYDWRIRGFSEEDKDGCVIDKRTAQELFGTADAVGREVLLEDRTYTVRLVADWSGRLFVIRPTEKTAVFTRAFIQSRDGQAKENTASAFLMQYGLSGVTAETEIYSQASLAALFLMPFACFVSLFLYAVRERKNSRESRLDFWMWTGICGGLLVIAVCFIWKNFRIPADWLPSQWSDFQFWPDKLESEAEKMKIYSLMPKTIMQAENMSSACRSILFSVLSLGLYVFKSPVFHRRERS